jgi:hypothetical protein
MAVFGGATELYVMFIKDYCGSPMNGLCRPTGARKSE